MNVRGLRAVALLLAIAGHPACGQDHRIPRTLSNAEFWRLSATLSEPGGAFKQSDNLVSNETHFAEMIRLLGRRGGVYVGVGPEQNFSYIAGLRPDMAFIVDIRRENRNLHFLYKALFELSSDRASFLSRLFSRERPAADRDASVEELFAALARQEPDRELHAATVRLVREHLLGTRQLPLEEADFASIAYVLDAFFTDGPDIQYTRSRPASASGPSYRVLMTATDLRRARRSYLATEEAFAMVRERHARNLIVPIVGDFAGPDALRRVAQYVHDHRATVSVFYGSNVEVYLSRRQAEAFCTNLQAMPADWRTWFINNKGMQPLRSKLKTCYPPPSPAAAPEKAQ